MPAQEAFVPACLPAHLLQLCLLSMCAAPSCYLAGFEPSCSKLGAVAELPDNSM